MRRLTTLLGVNEVTCALHKGEIQPRLVVLDFTGDQEAVKRFPEAVRQRSFDVAELPVMTFLIARDHGLDFDLIPATVLARPPYQHLVQRMDRSALRPEDLAGRQVAIRSWSVTTVAQVRDVLWHDFGVDPTAINWISTEPPHVPECAQPAWVRQAMQGATPGDLLASGEVDAAILGGKTVSAGLRSLFDNPAVLTQSWLARSGGSRPINHLVAVRRSIANDAPKLVCDLFRQLAAANTVGIAANPDLAGAYPVGFAACRAGLEHAITMAREQGLIRTTPKLESLVADCLLDT